MDDKNTDTTIMTIYSHVYTLIEQQPDAIDQAIILALTNFKKELERCDRDGFSKTGQLVRVAAEQKLRRLEKNPN